MLAVQEGWVDGIPEGPGLPLSKVLNYLKLSGISRRNINGGWDAKVSGYVRGLKYNTASESIIIKANCFASMKPTTYKVYARLMKTTGDITEAYCECIAGLSETCTHVSALLFTVSELSENAFTGKQQSHDQSCTEQLCKWIDPRSTSRPGQPEPFKDITFQRNLINKVSASPTKRPTFTPYPSSVLNVKKFEELWHSLNGINPKIMWLRYPLTKNAELEVTPSHKKHIPVYPDHKDLWLPEFQAMIEDQLKKGNIILTQEEREKITKDTFGQASNPNWFQERKGKLCASLFGKMHSCHKPEYLIKSVLYFNAKISSEAIVYGRKNEPSAVEAYKQLMAAYDKDVEIMETGLFISAEYSYLGASPDRIVKDGEEFGILEVKCPYSKQGMTPMVACLQKDFCCQIVDGELTLKRKHPYYYQVQGQLAVTGYKWCDFVIWTNNGGLDQSVAMERIYFDEELWTQELLPSLLHFYKYAIVPELLTTRVKRLGKLYLHEVGYIPFLKKKSFYFSSVNTHDLKVTLRKFK